MQIDLTRPHDRNTQRFKDLVDHFYEVMTNPEADVARAAVSAVPLTSPFAKRLPHVRIGGVSGFLDLLAQHPGDSEELSEIAAGLAVTIDDLLTILEAATLLDFAAIFERKISLTAAGREFTAANMFGARKSSVVNYSIVFRFSKQSCKRS